MEFVLLLEGIFLCAKKRFTTIIMPFVLGLAKYTIIQPSFVLSLLIFICIPLLNSLAETYNQEMTEGQKDYNNEKNRNQKIGNFLIDFSESFLKIKQLLVFPQGIIQNLKKVTLTISLDLVVLLVNSMIQIQDNII